MKELFELFWLFAKMGSVTFGGGYAMLPMLQKEVVDKYHWATEDELMDYYAIGQCTPGIIAVNTATFIGYKRRGLIGAAFSTLGMVFPSLVIITVIAAFIQNFAHIEAVQHAFAGIRVAVCVLILTAVIKLGKNAIKDKAGLVIFLLVVAGGILLSASPVLIVVLAAVAGVVIRKVRGRA